MSDLTPSNVRYRPETGHIWFVSMTSGFHVVELAGTGPAKDLGLPPAAKRKPCRRALRIKLPRRLRRATVYVNGRRVKRVRGRDLRVPVVLRQAAARQGARPDRRPRPPRPSCRTNPQVPRMLMRAPIVTALFVLLLASTAAAHEPPGERLRPFVERMSSAADGLCTSRSSRASSARWRPPPGRRWRRWPS